MASYPDNFYFQGNLFLHFEYNIFHLYQPLLNTSLFFNQIKNQPTILLSLSTTLIIYLLTSKSISHVYFAPDFVSCKCPILLSVTM